MIKADLLFVGLSFIGPACVLAAQEKAPAVPNPEKMDVLKELSRSFEEVSQRSGRAVVQIFVRSYVAADSSETRASC